MPALPQPPLLVVTDRKQARRPLEEVAEAVFAAGCRWLLLREKDLPAEERLALATRLSALAQQHSATLAVGADLEAARHADGLHLPRDGNVSAARAALGPNALIGLSAHDLAEARAAAAAGADYVTLSPVFESVSKPGYGPALGPAAVRRAVDALPIPVLALGGIAPDNAAGCMAAGAAGVAVMGDVMRAEEPGETVAALLASLRRPEADAGQIRDSAAQCGETQSAATERQGVGQRRGE